MRCRARGRRSSSPSRPDARRIGDELVPVPEAGFGKPLALASLCVQAPRFDRNGAKLLVVGDPTRIDKFRELTDEEIDAATVDELRAAYRALLSHHIAETEKLWQKLRAARASEPRRE